MSFARMKIVQSQVDCSSPEEFLDALSPLGKYFRESQLDEPWLFRGQGVDKPLIPALFRKPNFLHLLTKRKVRSHSDRLLAERDILIQFFNIADKRGLVIPDDSQSLRSTLEVWASNRGTQNIIRGTYEWLKNDEALSLPALAQHYGIPTRLLDWTMRPLIAAYFAAEDAVKPINKKSSHLVVWAFFFPTLGKCDHIVNQDLPIRIVTAPSATNPNLKAQQAVFTLLHPRYTQEATGVYLPMEQVLEDIAETADPERSDADKLSVGSQLRKFTLPCAEAVSLLYLLAKLDITPSAIYPGFHSIVNDLQMQNRW